MSPDSATTPKTDDDAATPSVDAPRDGRHHPSEGGAQVSGRAGRNTPLLFAVLVPLLLFFVLPPLSKSGLWDPYELNVADLGRRIALRLLGASNLELSGADNSLPYLNDLGRPQLPFTSIAIGFRLFGLHEWAGRLPLALWGLAGVLATYGFVARLSDRRAGLYSAIALSTTPLYMVQARTMMGDIVAMSSLAMAFFGLATAAFDGLLADGDAQAEGGMKQPYRGARQRSATGRARGVDEKGATTPGVSRARAIGLAVFAIGALAGYYSRGGLLGAAVPCLAIGLTALAVEGSSPGRMDAFGRAVAMAAFGIGVLGVSLTVRALGEDRMGDLNPWVGAMLKGSGKYPTFDVYIGQVAHALAPWSAFAPFALGRLFLPPQPEGREDSPLSIERESALRVSLLLGLACCLTAHGFLAARTDIVPFTGPALVAAACGLALRDFEKGAHASIAVGVGTAVLLALLHHDFHELPEKAYQVFGVGGAAFPEGFKERALALWWVALGLFALVAFFTWVERDAEREPFSINGNLRILNALRDAWDGILSLAYFAAVVGASLAAVCVYVGVRFHWTFVNALSLQVRGALLNAWWAIAVGPLAVIFAMYFACDVWLWAFGRAKPFGSASLTRGFEPFESLVSDVRRAKSTDEWMVGVFVLGSLMFLALPVASFALLTKAGVHLPIALAFALPSGLLAFLFLGAIGDATSGRRAFGVVLASLGSALSLGLFYYPALANQLSPKEVFESYQHARHGSEPLGLLGVGGRTAAYYAGGQPVVLPDAPAAFRWLVASTGAGAGAGERRFIAAKAEDLPKLNALYREHALPRANVPVIDARSSQIVLVASSLAPTDTNRNPFEAEVLSTVPKVQHRLDVNLEDKLKVHGFDLLDTSGHLVETVVPGRKYRMRTVYETLGPLGSEWEIFIHIDGYRRRHNGDHKPLAGKYPVALWNKGDILVDDYEFALEPNFSPGTYTLFFGFFAGDARLKVRSGASDGDNRINGGALHVQ